MLRFQPRQHRHLGTRLDLEHADGVGVLHHLVDRGVFLAQQAVHGDRAAVQLVDEVQRAPDGGEHAERQHIDFEQAQVLQVILVPLDDAALGHRCIFDRHQAREGPS